MCGMCDTCADGLVSSLSLRLGGVAPQCSAGSFAISLAGDASSDQLSVPSCCCRFGLLRACLPLFLQLLHVPCLHLHVLARLLKALEARVAYAVDSTLPKRLNGDWIRYGFTFLITAVIQGLGTAMLCPLLPLVAMEESEESEKGTPNRKNTQSNKESIRAPLLEVSQDGLDLIDAVPNAHSIN